MSGSATSAWFALHDEERPETEPPPPGEPEPWVVVRVDTDQDVYVEGEPVAITVEVCNTTDETQHHHSNRADPVGWWTDYANGGNPGSNGTSDGVTTTIEAHQCRSFAFEWDQIVEHASSDDPRGAQPGERAPAGEYRLFAHWDIFEWESESYRKGGEGLLTSTTFELR